MAKFSIGGDDDGEGPSNRNQKRCRVAISNSTDEVGNSSGAQDEGIEVAQHEEHVEDDEDFDKFVCFKPFPKDGGRENRDKSLSITLTDPEVLDCCICYEPLSIPIFQCENGHIACSSCCAKLMNKCPMCFMPIGYNRCRAVEKVLESVKISCPNAKYGCKERVSYSKKNDHENQCIHAPCTCPHSDCYFAASFMKLAIHFSCKHKGSATYFTYDRSFLVFLKVADEVIILQEQNDDDLFILHNKVVSLGNIVNVNCIGPNPLESVCHYDILARSQEKCCLKLQSLAKNTRDGNAMDTESGFLLIPSGFFGSSGQLKLEICISCYDTRFLQRFNVPQIPNS